MGPTGGPECPPVRGTGILPLTGYVRRARVLRATPRAVYKGRAAPPHIDSIKCVAPVA